ncbi:MAG: ATP-binding protein [Chryseosolibacter sp.]
MIYFFGLATDLEDIRQHLDQEFTFRQIDHVPPEDDLEQASLFLIGRTVDDPVKYVQEIVLKNKFLTILVLCEKNRYNEIKQRIQFSLFTGKTTTCLVYTPDADLSEVLRSGILRTQQKRSFVRFNLAAVTKLSVLSAVSVRIDNLGHILENAPMGALLVNSDLNIIGANNRARQMFLPVDENYISMNVVFPYRAIEVIRENITAGNEKVFAIEDLQGNHYEVTASAVEQKESVNTLLLFNDVTENVLKSRRVEAILESLPQIAWTAAPDGKIDYYTDGWYSYTSKDNSESRGNAWASAVHPEDLPSLQLKWEESIRDKKRFQQAARLRRFDGAYRWHLTRAVPIYAKNRNVMMWVGTSTDIHDQVLRTEELERKVKERTKELEETNSELEHFAHISSHDLQEPLRKIQIFSHIVKDEGGHLLNEHLNRYVDKIISTSHRMSKLLKDLLSFTKINQHEEEAMVDLNETIGHIKEDLELIIQQSRAAILVERMPVIKARPMQIKQLFYNLINNALKFRMPDVTPIISIHYRKLPADVQAQYEHLLPNHPYWEFVVGDNGIGFEQKYADQIFHVFQRLHTRSSYEGTGIGLAISRKIVTNHRGEIFAVSAVGQGSEFHIILPAIDP